MNRKWISLMVICAISLTLTGCGTITDRINRLSINMNKDEVRALFGNKFVAKASKVDKDGNVLDLWEFYDQKKKETYQIFFLNDKVSQWGKRNDLKIFPELHAPAYNP